MFDSHQKSAGAAYTMTTAFLLAFSPMVLMTGSPGHVAVSLAAAASGFCIVLAWVNWKKRSRVTIPSIEAANLRIR